ncbi:MAG: PDZ domain-containing protein [Alphaproteobacteria bacterium]
MANGSTGKFLHGQMAHVVALEADVQAALEALSTNTHPGITAMANDIAALTQGQGAALADHLQAIGGGGAAAAEYDDALGPLRTAVIKVLTGYATLQVLTRRHGHGSPTPNGETDDLGQKNRQNHVKALQDINQLSHDIVLWELDRTDHPCQCPCPSCSLGVCLCAVSSRAVQRAAWGEGAAVKEAGVFVHSPPPGSAAAQGGLRHGNVIVTADGQEVDVFSTLQGVVKGHASGETIALSVRRNGGAPTDVTVIRN